MQNPWKPDAQDDINLGYGNSNRGTTENQQRKEESKQIIRNIEDD